MNRKLLSMAVAVAALAATASPAAEFSVTIGSPVGSVTNCGAVSVGPSATPVSEAIACLLDSPSGGMNGMASASFGQVGAVSGAFHNGNHFGTAVGIGATARFADFVTFTKIDSSGGIITVDGMNLAFSGVQNATAAGNANVVANLFFGGGFSFEANEDSQLSNSFQLVSGTLSGGASDALLRSGSIDVFLDQPIFFAMSISVASGVAGDAGPQSARSDFSNTLEVPFGMDVFVVPAGVTANSGTWLVNNRRVDLNVSPVPEPGTWAMMIAGLGAIGFSKRLRRRKRAALA